MFKRSLLTASAVLALAAAPALAQQHPRGGMGGHPGMMGPGMMGYGMMGQMAGPMMGYGMMMSGKPQPAMLLQASERLELTDEQVGRLTELQQHRSQEVQQNMQAAMTAQQEAASALQADSPDLDAYQTALRQAADHMVAARVAGARASLDAWNVLTPQQQQEVTDALSTMGAMYHGMMGGAGMGWGMMGGPGMRGGMRGGGMMHRMMHGGSEGGGATPGAGGGLY